MSKKRKKTPGPQSPGDPEGWESLAEESGGTLAPNPELEEALREAAEAVEARVEPDEGDLLEVDPLEEGAPEPALETDETAEEPNAELVKARERLLRLHADFENFRRRAFKERQEIRHYGYQNLVKDLLSTVDNLDRAIDHVRKSEGEDFESLLKGVELVRKELLGVLAKYEVNEIEARGKSFDPALHEAMAQAPDSSVPQGTVIEVLQKGYQLRERLVRPARVVVATTPAGEKDSAEGEASD